MPCSKAKATENKVGLGFRDLVLMGIERSCLTSVAHLLLHSPIGRGSTLGI